MLIELTDEEVKAINSSLFELTELAFKHSDYAAVARGQNAGGIFYGATQAATYRSISRDHSLPQWVDWATA